MNNATTKKVNAANPKARIAMRCLSRRRVGRRAGRLGKLGGRSGFCKELGSFTLLGRPSLCTLKETLMGLLSFPFCGWQAPFATPQLLFG
jgi:hypothetical protein